MENLGFRIKEITSLKHETFGTTKPRMMYTFLTNSSSTPVLCISTGKWYKDSASAAKDVNRSKSSIRKCCSGAQKLCAGFKWSWAKKKESTINVIK